MLDKLLKKMTVIQYQLGRKSRKYFRNNIERKKLTNKDFTIFSQNCVGGMIYHDLGHSFCSPTINIHIPAPDFLKFMQDVHYWLSQKITFVDCDSSYPVGFLGGEIRMDFVHYKSQLEALEAWERRKQRINWNNLYVVSCDEGLNDEQIRQFDNLPYENKIIFLSRPMSKIASGIYAYDFPNQTDARVLNFVNPFGKRYYQKYFDYIKWLNGEKDYKL